MTNQEALLAEVGLPADSKIIEKALLKAGLGAGATYSVESEAIINEAAIQVLKIVKATKSITQGGLTIQIDAAAIDSRISDLSGNPAPVVTGQPTIRDRTNFW